MAALPVARVEKFIAPFQRGRIAAYMRAGFAENLNCQHYMASRFALK